jgi:hypothetical protein
VEGWDAASVQVFNALEGMRLADVMLHADAPEVVAVGVMSMADAFLKPHTRVAFRAVLSALARTLARSVRDPSVLCSLMTYAGLMCPVALRGELMMQMTKCEQLPALLREWAREWALMIENEHWFDDDRVEEHFAELCTFVEHERRPLVLYFEHTCSYEWTAEELEGVVYNIPDPEMQDRIFGAFLDGSLGVDIFDDQQGDPLARLIRQQCQRRSFSEVALRLSASRCFTGVPEFDPCEPLNRALHQVYSAVSETQRNEALFAVLAEKRADGSYRAYTDVGQGSVYMIGRLFKCGASPFARDGSGVLLMANVRSSRLRGIVNGRHVIEHLRIEESTRAEIEQSIRTLTPAVWTPDLHRLFPADFRARVRVLLLFNRRMRVAKAVFLPRDPLHLLIQWLAVGELLGADVWEAELVKLQ